MGRWTLALLLLAGSARADEPRTAATLAKGWSEAALQLRDADRRAKALEEIRAALKGEDRVALLGALRAIAQIGTLKYDKASYRPLVLPHVDADEPEVRVAAFYALFNTVVEPDDLRLVLARVEKGDRQDAMSHLVMLFSKGDVTGDAGRAALTLLTARGHGTIREVLRGLWGARLSTDVEEEVLRLAKEPATRYDAIYFALSTLREKSAAVVEELIGAAGDPDANVWQRALWGLGHGVAEAEREKVANVMLDVLETRNDPQTREYALRALREYGAKEHAERLERLAKDEGLEEGPRREMGETAERIRRRMAALPAAPAAR